jgi:hypothetical protein
MVLVEDAQSGACALALILVGISAFVVLVILALAAGAVLGFLTASGLL